MAPKNKNNEISSTPNFFSFNPKIIPYQYRVIYDTEKVYDYSLGVHYVMLSGSVGSAKSTLMAWIIIRHCTKFKGARALIARKSLTDLKDTLFQKLLEMLTNAFKEGVDYTVNYSSPPSIRFKNGSEIISRSWSDRKFTKFRSLELSLIAVEELTENNTVDWKFFDELIARVGRLPHIQENLFISATNPDDPSHSAYEVFIKDSVQKGFYAEKDKMYHVYYSRTEDNPFLPEWYIEQLKKKYDEKMVRRMLYGEWLYIGTDVIYYQYDRELHFKLENTKPRRDLPLRLSFDFNIAKGKPMSSCLFQYDPAREYFTFIDEVAVEGARTLDALDEWQGKGYFDLPHNPEIIVHGDASGRHNDSRSKLSDYDIIEDYLANYLRKDGDSLDYSIEVPRSNPPLRTRHNIANGVLKNSEGVISLAIDKRCKIIDKGFSNTRLKENAGYIEDQTTEGQDMSTAVTYGIWYCKEYGQDDDAPVQFY